MEWPIGSLEVNEIPQEPRITPSEKFPRLLGGYYKLFETLRDVRESRNCFRGILVIQKPIVGQLCKKLKDILDPPQLQLLQSLPSLLTSLLRLSDLKEITNIKFVGEAISLKTYYLFVVDLPNIKKDDPIPKIYNDIIKNKKAHVNMNVDGCNHMVKTYAWFYIDTNSKIRKYEEYFRIPFLTKLGKIAYPRDKNNNVNSVWELVFKNIKEILRVGSILNGKKITEVKLKVDFDKKSLFVDFKNPLFYYAYYTPYYRDYVGSFLVNGIEYKITSIWDEPKFSIEYVTEPLPEETVSEVNHVAPSKCGIPITHSSQKNPQPFGIVVDGVIVKFLNSLEDINTEDKVNIYFLDKTPFKYKEYSKPIDIYKSPNGVLCLDEKTIVEQPEGLWCLDNVDETTAISMVASKIGQRTSLGSRVAQLDPLKIFGFNKVSEHVKYVDYVEDRDGLAHLVFTLRNTLVADLEGQLVLSGETTVKGARYDVILQKIQKIKMYFTFIVNNYISLTIHLYSDIPDINILEDRHKTIVTDYIYKISKLPTSVYQTSKQITSVTTILNRLCGLILGGSNGSKRVYRQHRYFTKKIDRKNKRAREGQSRRLYRKSVTRRKM